METWPSYAHLKFPGFIPRRQPAVIRSENESGPAKQAKVLSRVMVTRRVIILLKTKADYLSFLGWFNININRGTDWFNFTDPVSETVKSARIVGGVLEEEAPQDQMLNVWEIPAQIETWE